MSVEFVAFHDLQISKMILFQRELQNYKETD